MPGVTSIWNIYSRNGYRQGKKPGGAWDIWCLVPILRTGELSLPHACVPAPRPWVYIAFLMEDPLSLAAGTFRRGFITE